MAWAMRTDDGARARSVEDTIAVLEELFTTAEGGTAEHMHADVHELVRLIGVDRSGHEPIARAISYVLDAGAPSGLSAEVLGTLLQAYARGVGRVAAAEADIARRLLREVPPDARADLLARLVPLVRSLGARAFGPLHEAMLEDELRATVGAAALEDPAHAVMIVAHVDLVGSTAYLAARGHRELDGLVDALFEAGQHATMGSSARAVKYVGDGVFIAGGDARDTAVSAMDTVALLEAALPLRARAGLAHGPVSRRAGDILGLPVSHAQRLCKAAAPGTVLASGVIAPLLPAGMLGATGIATLHPSPCTVEVVEVHRELA
jgi:adenylate cyclase